MLRKVAQSMARPSQFLLFNTSMHSQVRLMPLQARMIHQRGYTNFDDHHSFWHNEINFALHAAKNTDNIVFVYKKYGQYMTDKQIMWGFNFIGKHKLEKTPEFWDTILPMVKEQIKGLDRQTTPALFRAIEGGAAMYLQDNEFWALIENKFVDEGLWRYFNLEDTAIALCMFARVGRGSDDIVELIEKHFIKHRKGLTPEVIQIAQEGFQRINKGSEILHRVLADPKTELPALE